MYREFGGWKMMTNVLILNRNWIQRHRQEKAVEEMRDCQATEHE